MKIRSLLLSTYPGQNVLYVVSTGFQGQGERGREGGASNKVLKYQKVQPSTQAYLQLLRRALAFGQDLFGLRPIIFLAFDQGLQLWGSKGYQKGQVQDLSNFLLKVSFQIKQLIIFKVFVLQDNQKKKIQGCCLESRRQPSILLF